LTYANLDVGKNTTGFNQYMNCLLQEKLSSSNRPSAYDEATSVTLADMAQEPIFSDALPLTSIGRSRGRGIV
jgi:hypothetical protein